MHVRFIRTLLFAVVVLIMSAASLGQVGVAISVGPPALPVYEQPLCPGDGYLWTPGYWAYDYDVNDYYWVPGTWVMPPEAGFLWTPAYWGWGGDGFVFYDGYWGPNVGFYGGINYGFGYFGEGFEGGRWDHGHFFYNRSVNNLNASEMHNVYNSPARNDNGSHVSYNGGRGGINSRPTGAEENAARERHIPPVAAQKEHAQAARANPQQRASENMGRPGTAATPRPGDFNDHAAVPAKEAGAPYTPANRGGNQARAGNNAAGASTAVHPRDLPPLARNVAPTNNPKRDQKYQKQQDKQIAKQQQERDQLQQRQDQEHVMLDKQKANDSTRQQTEQKHQQQTQELQQRHQQQTQQLQQRQQPQSRESGKR